MEKTIVDISTLIRLQDEFENAIKLICKFQWLTMCKDEQKIYSSRSEYIDIAIREFTQSLAVGYGMMK